MIAAWVERDIRDGSTLGPALSWARSFADLDSGGFERTLDVFRTALLSDVERNPSYARGGLIALGLANRARLERLVSVLHGVWRNRGLECVAVVSQLTTPSAGRLHPELEAIKRALS